MDRYLFALLLLFTALEAVSDQRLFVPVRAVNIEVLIAQSRPAPVDLMQSVVFQGCINFDITYRPLVPADPTNQQLFDTLLDDGRRTYGTRKITCYHDRGDWVEVYLDSNTLEKAVYIFASNTEYTVFREGMIRYGENTKEEIDKTGGFEVLSVHKTGQSRPVAGRLVNELSVVTSLGNMAYWVDKQRLINQKAYLKRYTAQDLKAIKYVPLMIVDAHVAFLKISTAASVSDEIPNQQLFELPDLPLIPWN